MEGKANELRRKMEALLQEVARKNEYLQQHGLGEASGGQTRNKRTAREQVTAVLKDVLEITRSPVRRRTEGAFASESTLEQYQALREIASRSSAVLEQEARKVALAWKTIQKDDDTQLSLLKCLVQPLETLVTSLMAAAQLTQMTEVLSNACVTRAHEACTSTVAMVDGLDTDALNSLCGMIESVCESIRKLPVSNAAAVKRQLLEAAKAIGDSQREFKSLQESGKVDWDFDDEEDVVSDDEGDMKADAIDDDDVKRLDAACNALAFCKQFLLFIGDQLREDILFLNALSNAAKDIISKATDFGVELYPPQDAPRVIQKATAFLAATTDLRDAFVNGSGAKETNAFDDFSKSLSLVIV